jgi:hypothetical protein
MTPKENAKGKIPLQLGDAKTFAAQSVCLVSSRSGVPPPTHTYTYTPNVNTVPTSPPVAPVLGKET